MTPKPQKRRLTQKDKDTAAELALSRGWSATRIARKLNCSLGSVTWYLLTAGIERNDTPPKRVKRSPSAPVTIQRGEHVVRLYTEEEDRMLLDLRQAGLRPTEIARRFTPPRKPNSVIGRLHTLARRDARIEAGATIV